MACPHCKEIQYADNRTGLGMTMVLVGFSQQTSGMVLKVINCEKCGKEFQGYEDE